MKIATIIGARPQFIKAAQISRIIAETSGMTEVLIHTGQHYDTNMSDIFFSELGIPEPAYNLGIGSGSHGKQTGRMLGAIEAVLMEEKADSVIIYGDTNSTLAGALAAVKIHLEVSHVEAGLRSFNKQMPEEVNRIVADHTADLLFTPTRTAAGNLIREGIPNTRIFTVGDVMHDAALFYAEKARSESSILERLGIDSKQYFLATIHRAENTDRFDRLQNILLALNELAETTPVILPLHPRTRHHTDRILSPGHTKIRFIEPVGYLDMIMLEKNAAVIATDSGGIQKEAFFHKTPCVTLRDETEWMELVEHGWNTLIPPLNSADIASGIRSAVNRCGKSADLYGDGDASAKIINIIKDR